MRFGLQGIVGLSKSLLGPADVCWGMLESAEVFLSCLYLLGPAEVCWALLGSAKVCWGLLVQLRSARVCLGLPRTAGLSRGL